MKMPSAIVHLVIVVIEGGKRRTHLIFISLPKAICKRVAEKHKPSVLVFADWILHEAFDRIKEVIDRFASSGSVMTHFEETGTVMVPIIIFLVVGVEIFAKFESRD